MALFGPYNAEINQLNTQIKLESGKISGYQYTLGVLLLRKLDEGMTFDDEIMEQYAAILETRANITACNTQLEEIQRKIAEEEAQRAAERERKQAEAAQLRAARAAEAQAKVNALLGRNGSQAPAAGFCPNCGNPLASGMLFCNKCGTKLG